MNPNFRRNDYRLPATIATDARHGTPAAVREFRSLAIANGYTGGRGGWIRNAEGRTICQGWQALADKVTYGIIALYDIDAARRDATIEQAAREIDAVATAADDGDRVAADDPDAPLALIYDLIAAARREWSAGRGDRARGFAQAAREELAVARTRQIDAAHAEALAVQRAEARAEADVEEYADDQADQAASDQHGMWLDRIEDHPAYYEHRATMSQTASRIRAAAACVAADEATTHQDNDARDADAAELEGRTEWATALRVIGRRQALDAALCDARIEDAHRAQGAGWPPADSDAPECGERYGHRWACRRPAGHSDGIGHAEVRYPEGTPEHAAYRTELLAALAEWAGVDPGPEPPTRMIGCAPALLIRVIGEACPLLGRHAHREDDGRVVDGVAPEPGLFGAAEYQESNPPTVRVGDLMPYAEAVDTWRSLVWAGDCSWDYAIRTLVAATGVTREGAAALLRAESTADLAAPHPCGDWPAPCNCDDPATHNGH